VKRLAGAFQFVPALEAFSSLGGRRVDDLQDKAAALSLKQHGRGPSQRCRASWGALDGLFSWRADDGVSVAHPQTTGTGLNRDPMHGLKQQRRAGPACNPSLPRPRSSPLTSNNTPQAGFVTPTPCCRRPQLRCRRQPSRRRAQPSNPMPEAPSAVPTCSRRRSPPIAASPPEVFTRALACTPPPARPGVLR